MGSSPPPLRAVVPDGVATAARAEDWEGVRSLLAPHLADGGPQGELARVLLGLHAHGTERVDEARRWLDRPPAGPAGPLDDWASWVLADCLAALGETTGARNVLEELLLEPGSVLLAAARVRAAELAAADGDLVAGWAHVEAGRLLSPEPILAERLERVAWDLATREGRLDAILATARRLVVRHPNLAEKLEVRRWLGLPSDGTWAALLAAPEILELAGELLARDDAEGAWDAALTVPEPDRDAAWTLLAAETRVATGDGRGALSLLEDTPRAARPEGPPADWVRARALLLAARPRPRDPLTSRQRQAMRREATIRLEAAARGTADPTLRLRVLSLLFEELASDERIDEALAVRRRILDLDPESDAGRAFLWARGWRELESRNPTGAIGYFSELASEPRQDRTARGARYWLARNWERLGDLERARALDRELASSEIVDFYHRHAVAHLGGTGSPRPTPPAAAPWPRHATLDRARFLTDVGLDALALHELRGTGEPADRGAANALEGLILARQGHSRESMTPLYRAFPSVATAAQGRVPLLARQLYYPRLHAAAIEPWAETRGLSPWLVFAVVRQESAFDERATSRAGARGLMQLMTPTARELAHKLGLGFEPERLYEPGFNIELGTRYLRQVLDLFDGDVELALAGYNGGPYRIRRWWRERPSGVGVDRFVDGLPLAETRVYVHRILLLADSYRVLYESGKSRRSGYTTEPDRALWVHSSAVRASGS